MRSRTAPVTLALLLLVPVLPVSAAEPTPAPPVPKGPGVVPPGAEHLDPSGRYIVVVDEGADPAAVTERHARRQGLKADGVFRAVGGFAGKMTKAQVTALRADPDVAAVVPDEIVEVASQLVPTGVSRIGTRSSATARLDGVDQRVNADVAIVDTGIDPNHPELNVVGGYNCSTSDRSLWRDRDGHGTHVAGTVGAIDNSSGVVGVAPGVRLWAVKILDDTGFGLLSWYVCGLDWIASRRDPANASRPLIEAVNMSVAKWGSDDGNCGFTNSDVLHRAICRVTNAGVVVVAAAANDSGNAASRVPAAYNEVITVSALADTDGKSGGTGGARCWSWGTYDVDDTFADFSNYGSDVDIIAPGKCIWSTLPGNRYGYSSGTSMAAPAVTGAAALFLATRTWPKPSEVKLALQVLGNHNWRTSTDPDSAHERHLDVSRIATGGDYTVALGTPNAVGSAGGSVKIPVTIQRTPTSFETVTIRATTPPGMPVTADRTTVTGFGSGTATLTVTVPPSLATGRYPVTVTATQGSRLRQATTNIVVENDVPVVGTPVVTPAYRYSLRGALVPVRVSWPAATDPSSTITAYEVQQSMDRKPWSPSKRVSGSSLSTVLFAEANHAHRFQVRARDAAGNWSAWVESANLRLGAVDDQAANFVWSPRWSDVAIESAYLGQVTRTRVSGASTTISMAARQLALVAEVGPTNGWLDVTVNGVYQGRVSLWNATRVDSRVLWVKDFRVDATMRVDLKSVVSATRTSANVDALLVGR